MSAGTQHPHSHTHEVAGRSNQRRLKAALIFTAGFVVVEVVGGLVSGSLALLADAGHMLADAMALGLALAAFRLSERPADARRSYGYHRFQILAAFVNGVALIGITLWICIEAIGRFMRPVEVAGGTMLWVAIAGLVVNIAVFLVVHRPGEENLNLRGAALHVLGDLLGSVAAIIAAIVILTTGWTTIDPLLSLVVAGLIVRSAWDLVQRSAHVLLEGAPDDLDSAKIRQELITSIAGVADVHHVHIWGLTPQKLVITLHVVLSSSSVDPLSVIPQVKQLVQSRYGISHSTVEVELEVCADDRQR